MSLQYITNNNGYKTAVLIPIQEWEAITYKYKDLKRLGGKKTYPIKKPSDFRGNLSQNIAEKIQRHLIKARKEWDRDTF